MTFQSQATGAMRFQRLLTEMLTAQNLADDTDGLGQVDCWVFFRHCLFSVFQAALVRSENSCSTSLGMRYLKAERMRT